MKILAIAIGAYLIGLLVFYTFAVFDTRAWDTSYFLWAKTSDAGCLSWLVIYKLLRVNEKGVVKPLLLFSFVRLLWDLFSLSTGISINNERGVAACFLALVMLISYLIVREFKKIRQYN